MMDSNSLNCPFCGIEIAESATECPNCHENLAAWTRVHLGYAIDYNEALAMAREGRLDEAKVKLIAALQAKESFAPAHILLAKVNAQQGRWTEAQHSAQRACELLPDDARTKELADAIASRAGTASRPALDAGQQEGQALAESPIAAQHPRVPGSMVLGPHWLGRYQQDIVRAFAVGVGLTTMMAWLISRLAGKRSK